MDETQLNRGRAPFQARLSIREGHTLFTAWAARTKGFLPFRFIIPDSGGNTTQPGRCAPLSDDERTGLSFRQLQLAPHTK
jgi:hypothetical protein